MKFEIGNAKRKSLEESLKVDAHRNGFGDHEDERLERSPDRVIPADVSDCPAIKIQFRQYSWEMEDTMSDLAHEIAIEEMHTWEGIRYAS
jgi:hypothetical protein